MELKTLKDIEMKFIHTKKPSNRVKVTDLKHEAIKWIKEIERSIDKKIGTHIWNRLTNKEKRATIFWIKHFFNITEEDLK